MRNKTVVRDKMQEITGINLPCAKPLEYAIGTVDPRFNLSVNDFLAEAQDAEKIWEAQSGKDLFEYNPNADFKINLIFDSRQIQSNEADKLAQDLDQLEVSHKKITDQYENFSETYEQKMVKYKKNAANYEKKVKEYNEAVEDWNESAKTSEEEFNELKEKKEELGGLYKKLEKERLEVNKLAGKTNALATKEKSVVDDYNANVETYKNKYGGGREFEKGVYDGKEINLYQFKEKSDLRMTLIHELGHALGIGHLEDSKSIMYYLLSDQDMENPIFSAEDLGALKDVCKFQ